MFLESVCCLSLCTLLLMQPELPEGRCYIFPEYAFVLSVQFLNYIFRSIINMAVVFDVNTCMLVEWNITFVI